MAGRGSGRVFLVHCFEGVGRSSGPPATPAANQEAQRLARLPPIVPYGARIDHSGREEKGRVSYYSRHFNNRNMANGKRFNPNSDVAASKTLPLGTTAKVTNLQNGKSATVQVEDRGPFIGGRVVDVTPKVADSWRSGSRVWRRSSLRRLRCRRRMAR